MTAMNKDTTLHCGKETSAKTSKIVQNLCRIVRAEGK